MSIVFLLVGQLCEDEQALGLCTRLIQLLKERNSDMLGFLYRCVQAGRQEQAERRKRETERQRQRHQVRGRQGCSRWQRKGGAHGRPRTPWQDLQCRPAPAPLWFLEWDARLPALQRFLWSQHQLQRA